MFDVEWEKPGRRRTRGALRLQSFEKGAFHMTAVTGVPLVPVVVSPLERLYDLENRCIRPGTAEVRVLEPFPTHELAEEDIPRLMQEAHRRMAAALEAVLNF